MLPPDLGLKLPYLFECPVLRRFGVVSVGERSRVTKLLGPADTGLLVLRSRSSAQVFEQRLHDGGLRLSTGGFTVVVRRSSLRSIAPNRSSIVVK
jgi:hypothetical protein